MRLNCYREYQEVRIIELGMKRSQVKRRILVIIWTLSSTILSGGGINMVKPTPQIILGGYQIG